MPNSDYFYLSGDPLLVGEHGDSDYFYHSGDPVPNLGGSDYVFESGSGLGGVTAEIEITDSLGSSTGTITLFSRADTVENFYDFTNNDDFFAAQGEINDYLEVGYTTFFVFENTNTGERSFGFVHDKAGTDNQERGGEVDMDVTNLPSGASFAVRDDDPGNDTYSMNPPDAFIDHQWGGNDTDGVAIGKFTESELQGITVTFDVVRHTDRNGNGPPHTIRFVGDGGTTVERSYDGTNTKVNITFGL